MCLVFGSSYRCQRPQILLVSLFLSALWTWGFSEYPSPESLCLAALSAVTPLLYLEPVGGGQVWRRMRVLCLQVRPSQVFCPWCSFPPPCNLFPSLAAEFPVRFLEAVTFCWSFPLRFVWKASRGWSGRSVLSQLGESSGSVFCPGANAFALETALGCFTVITFPFPCQSRGDLSVSPHSWWGPSRVLEVKPAEVWEPPPQSWLLPQSFSLSRQVTESAASVCGSSSFCFR